MASYYTEQAHFSIQNFESIVAHSQKTEKLQQFLKKGPARTASILRELGISQPTFSRLWATVRDGVVLGAGKARQYALRHELRGVDVPVPVFRVSEGGGHAPIGHLHVLQGECYATTPLDGTGYEVFKGLPFFIRDLRPQGFLGRLEPARNRDLDLPDNILYWTDEHVLTYISRRSEHAAGNLIFGNESYARYIQSLAALEQQVIPAGERVARYPGMAEAAMLGEPPGSSAGGEQPKFTAMIRREDGGMVVEHVIVKFSPQVNTPFGRRWADLLICEHLALQVLASSGIAAAKTTILESDSRIFLEVVRFDRAGLRGRLPMATFSALDGDLGMMDQNWTAVARELGRLGELSAQDIVTVEMLDLFGSLIGNTDKHHGNIAVSWTFERKHHLLDAYDMLPMLYRPNAHGEVIEREWLPAYMGRVELRHLSTCYAVALRFWEDVLNDPRISEDFKGVAHRHMVAISVFAPASGAD